MKSFLALGLVGCAVAAPKHVRVDIQESDPVLHDQILQGVGVWHELGFTADETDQPGDELVMITLLKEIPDHGEGQLVGWTDLQTRTIQLRIGLVDNRLIHTAAHEMGHMFGWGHLQGQNTGIMNPQINTIIEPTPEDYSMICKTVGYCL